MVSVLGVGLIIYEGHHMACVRVCNVFDLPFGQVPNAVCMLAVVSGILCVSWIWFQQGGGGSRVAASAEQLHLSRPAHATHHHEL